MNNIKEVLEGLIRENLSDFELDEQFEQRSVGDKIENDCKEIAKRFFETNYISPRSKKSLEDFTLTFGDNINWFDVKTHFIQEVDGFSMPNLVSIDKLKRSLKNDNESIIYIFVSYKRENGKITIEHVYLKYIWELDWSILGIGNLGKGQLQIKNANKEVIFTTEGKEVWGKKLNLEAVKFYNKRIEKIKKELLKWS
jgi:hypothetical protein